MRLKIRVLISIIVFYVFYCVYFYSTETLERSEWTCQGDSNRSTVCEFTHFCIDKWHGPFIYTDSPQSPPSINMINTGSDEDMWLTPAVVNTPRRVRYIDDTLMVYGLYAPFHFSHYLYNGLLPLFSTLREHNMTRPQWLLRTTTYKSKYTKVDMQVFPGVHDVILENGDAPYIPLCFAKAIVGTGDRCSLWYCERDIPQVHLDEFKHQLNAQLVSQDDACLQNVQTYGSGGSALTIAILNRHHSRYITNVPELIDTLRQHYPKATIHLLNFDDGCDLRSTAHLLESVDVFIAPFGNALGAGLFMKPNAIVISIDARWYTEDWFYWPLTSVGVRLYHFPCERASCQEYEPALVRSLAPHYSQEDIVKVMTLEAPDGVDRLVVEYYRKDVSRKVDIERFIPFLNSRLNTTQYYCNDACRKAIERHQTQHLYDLVNE
ncbi:hypothetical protein BC940DRAFT_309853 [Gongronella butleri]|nr:hypothetical protein BC940DRAFT_309853 [Gongronella butleri]